MRLKTTFALLHAHFWRRVCGCSRSFFHKSQLPWCDSRPLLHFYTLIFHHLTPDLKELLNPVPGSAYDSVEGVGGCLQGTRQDVIEWIIEWIDGHNDRPICWLYGAAGFGKSAISRSIAGLCEYANRLGASFYFWRGNGRRSVIANFISTLAYHLAFSVPETRPYIETILLRDPMIIHQLHKHQLQNLIVNPILLVTQSLLPMVIVVDGIYKCNNKQMMADLISVIAQAF